MCLVAVSVDQHPEYSIILATNRDEFYERPARPARFWSGEGYPALLAGKDMREGGTWMGVNTYGQWGLVTNYRDPSINRDPAPSRGNLVSSFLTSEQNAPAFLEETDKDALSYNGFNLLLGDGANVHYYSNIERKIQLLESGIFTLSNALLNDEWPKTRQIETAFRTVTAQRHIDVNDLLHILTDTTRPPDSELPDTGIPPEWEHAISPVFIRTADYGTRCSTVLLIHRSGAIYFTERTYDKGDPGRFSDRSFTI